MAHIRFVFEQIYLGDPRTIINETHKPPVPGDTWNGGWPLNVTMHQKEGK